jgi:hypothetical protein
MLGDAMMKLKSYFFEVGEERPRESTRLTVLAWRRLVLIIDLHG